MKRALLAALAAAISVSAVAAPVDRCLRIAQARVNALIIYGNDPCPRGGDDEIVVCARKPEGERFRIPEAVRGDPNDPANRSWADRAQTLEYAGRTGIGSCTPVGPGGSTGCLSQLLHQAREERRQTDVNMVHLIEQAREARNAGHDAEAACESAQEHATTPSK
jgi:hypothetical protein